MAWFSLRVEAGCNQDLRLVLHAAWTVAFEDASLNFRCAVFCMKEVGGGSTLFFSPEARALADALGAKPCRNPSREGLTLVVGDARAWEACFWSDPPSGRLSGARRLSASADEPVPSSPAPL